jgi:hypothetical protein
VDKKKRFHDIAGKNDSHAHMQEKKHDHPQIRLNGQILEVKNIHKILGISFDNRLTWKAHITGAKAKAGKRINVLRSLAGTNWGADQMDI